MKEDKAIQFLERLVSLRFNEQSLNEYLSKFFGVEVKVEDISKDDDELADYNYIFNIDTKHLFIDIDIYFSSIFASQDFSDFLISLAYRIRQKYKVTLMFNENESINTNTNRQW